MHHWLRVARGTVFGSIWADARAVKKARAVMVDFILMVVMGIKRIRC